MTLADIWQQAVEYFSRSHIFRGTVFTGAAFLALLAILALLLGVTLLLRLFFRHHPLITKARRVLIYLLTMGGVIILILAGIIGLFLPVVPGTALILAGLLLMRKYHRIPVIERAIAYCKRKVAQERERYLARKRGRAGEGMKNEAMRGWRTETKGRHEKPEEGITPTREAPAGKSRTSQENINK